METWEYSQLLDSAMIVMFVTQMSQDSVFIADVATEPANLGEK